MLTKIDYFGQYKFQSTLVNFWLVDLKQQTKDFTLLLTKEELERAKKFKFITDQNRFIIARGYLKSILNQYIDIDFSKINFIYNKYGKPFLDTSKLPKKIAPIFFNLAHSGDYALIAVNEKYNIGADLEMVKPLENTHTIIQRFFNENEYIQFKKISTPEQLNYFYALWACKEAFVKALGTGIFCNLDSFAFNLDTLEPNSTKPHQTFLVDEITQKDKFIQNHVNQNWHIINFTPTNKYQAAIVLRINYRATSLKIRQ